MKGNYKKCKQRLHDCFACDENGYCQVLKNTDFKRRNGKTYKCPFYKKKSDVNYDFRQFDVAESDDDDENEEN